LFDGTNRNPVIGHNQDAAYLHDMSRERAIPLCGIACGAAGWLLSKKCDKILSGDRKQFHTVNFWNRSLENQKPDPCYRGMKG
jgi:serine/threonine protein phosphatase PrpC